MKIYGDRRSGNCLKVSCTANYLDIPYEWVRIDIMQGESRTAEFLQRSRAGQVPVVALDDERTLAQSNAIIRYMARDSSLLPSAPFLQAKVDEWLFWEQYSHEPYIAVCRFQMLYLGKAKNEREGWRVERGEQALDLLNDHLNERNWLVGDALSLADIALLAYTRVAHEGGFDLTARTHVKAWIERSQSILDWRPRE